MSTRPFLIAVCNARANRPGSPSGTAGQHGRPLILIPNCKDWRAGKGTSSSRRYWTAARGEWGWKIGLLAGLITAVFYLGPGFAEVLDHQAARILLLNPENVHFARVPHANVETVLAG